MHLEEGAPRGSRDEGGSAKVQNIHDEIAAAMRYARKRAGLTAEQFAREINRLINAGLDKVEASHVSDWEDDGGRFVLADELIAAARIAELPVSTCLGELAIFTATIPALEQRIIAL